MTRKSLTPRGFTETQMPPNDGDVPTYDEATDMYKPKPGGVPAAFGIGASTEIEGITVNAGPTSVVSLDPAAPGSVLPQWLNGITLNGTKDGFVIGTAGHYEVITSFRCHQHATAWLLLSSFDDSSSNLESETVIPPATVFNTGAHMPSTYTRGVADLNPGDVVQFYLGVLGATVVIQDSYVCIKYIGPRMT